MKIKDKYSVKIITHSSTINDKDKDLLLYTIKQRNFNENNIIEELIDQVKVLFMNNKWKAATKHYHSTVFIKDAYTIDFYRNNNMKPSLTINLLSNG